MLKCAAILGAPGWSSPIVTKSALRETAPDGIGGRLRALRLYWGHTQQQLAERADLGRSEIALVETNRNKGSSKRMRAGLATAFGVTAELLNSYLNEQISERDVAAQSTRKPKRPPSVVGDAPLRRGRPPGARIPGAWGDEGAVDEEWGGPCPARRSLVVSDSSSPLEPEAVQFVRFAESAAPHRLLSSVTSSSGTGISAFPNLQHAALLVAEHLLVDLEVVEHSALALALAAESAADRSVLAWARLLERHVLLTRSGTYLNPWELPALGAAIRRLVARGYISEDVERQAAEAINVTTEPHRLGEADWVGLMESGLSVVAAGTSEMARTEQEAGASGSSRRC